MPYVTFFAILVDKATKSDFDNSGHAGNPLSVSVLASG
jgi:hypothetical protein